MVIMRWVVLLLLPVAFAKPLVGAIRWDAWYGAPPGNAGIVGRTVTGDLSPDRWHYRLPFFGQEHSAANYSLVDVNGNKPEVMSAELAYASEFGIDFWALCTYPIGCKDYSPPDSACPYIQCCADNYQLSYALNLYLNNPDNHKVKFSLILQSGGQGWFPAEEHGGNETLDQETDRFVSYFRMPQYQKVAGGRPLVFSFNGDAQELARGIGMLRSKTIAAGLPPPYLVYMGGGAPASQLSIVKSIGFDGASNYVTVRDWSSRNASFALNAAFEESYWREAASVGLQIVPPITAGWDPRPRFDYGYPWGPPANCGTWPNERCWTEDPSMDQLTALTSHAINFTIQNPRTVPANAVLISAWNEHDEGHWIEPSLLAGPEKLEAIKKAIDMYP